MLTELSQKGKGAARSGIKGMSVAVVGEHPLKGSNVVPLNRRVQLRENWKKETTARGERRRFVFGEEAR